MLDLLVLLLSLTQGRGDYFLTPLLLYLRKNGNSAQQVIILVEGHLFLIVVDDDPGDGVSDSKFLGNISYGFSPLKYAPDQFFSSLRHYRATLGETLKLSDFLYWEFIFSNFILYLKSYIGVINIKKSDPPSFSVIETTPLGYLKLPPPDDQQKKA